MRIDRKGIIIGMMIGVLFSMGAVFADDLWHQKVTVEVTVPRRILISFSSTNLVFGVIDDSVTETLTITNENSYAVTLYWTVLNVPEGLTFEVYNGAQELEIDKDSISLSPNEVVTVSIVVTNIDAEATTGTDVTHIFTMKWYYAG